MSKRIALVLCAVLGIAGVLGAASFPGHSQGRPRTVETQPLVKPQSLIVETSSPKPAGSTTAATVAVNPVFLQAATQNTTLRNGLSWLFGGKQQHGWYLYNSLIQKLVGNESDSNTPEFAQAISRWQQQVGLAPTGILDSDTLYQMVATWQGVRSKDHEYPSESELITAPPSEFLHPERPAELRQVRKDAYEAYHRMLAAAISDPTLKLKTTSDGQLAPDEQFFKIVSSFRSREYQAQLRKQAPHAGSAGLAINSPHFTGRALDLYVGGDPVETNDFNRAVQVNTPAYKWLVKNAEKFGFYPYYYEPWHWEYKPSQQSTEKSASNQYRER
jgi:LAS superfamily LD-carboxypeptidase LdcB